VTPGWEDSAGLLALVDLADDVAYTIVVITQDRSFDAAGTDVIRAFASMLRQFFARVRIERDLQQRLDLEDFVAASVARFAASTEQTFPDIVVDTLEELIRRLQAPAAEVFHISPERVVSEYAVGPTLSEVWRDFEPVGDGRFINRDLSPSFFPVATLASAFFGSDAPEIADGDDRVVALFPSEVGDATRTCIALAGPPRTWTAVEQDAVATIGATLAQTRARLAAERDSRYRHGLQAEIAAVAADFLWVRDDDVDAVIHDALGRVARQFGATAAFVVDLHGQKSGRAVVVHPWGDERSPFDRGQTVLYPKGWESSLDDLEPRAGVLPLDGWMDAEFRGLLDHESGQFSLVSVPLLPGTDSTPVVGIALPGDHSSRFETITEMAATFADLLSQLNSRLALESAESHRASTQLFLREAAATLAEAADTDYHDVVTGVLSSTVDFLELDELSTWRVDLPGERFVARHVVGGAEAAGSELPFGVDAVMDEARTAIAAIERQERVDDGTLISTVALRRGVPDAMTITVACRAGGAPLCE
ncbi:MAG: hypothetical protein AAGG08_20380, partial [Actinomycetota bacterium]